MNTREAKDVDPTDKQDELIVRRPHTCPVVYLENFAHISPKYYEKLSSFTTNTYREPKRNEYLISAHDKTKNTPVFETSLNNIGVRKLFYSNKIEAYLSKIESHVSTEFNKIRRIINVAFIDPLPIFKFIMCQLVRTPKFQKKIKEDLIYLKNMSEDEYKQSLMRLLLVQKPNEVTSKLLKKTQEQIIEFNTLENTFKWAQLTLVTNNTKIPFITSDSPVFYNNAEFLYSYLSKLERIETTLIINEHSLFYFTIDPQFAVLIQNFDQKRKEPLIRYEDIFDENLVMILNTLIYQYSEKLVLMRNKDSLLIKNIRQLCRRDIDKKYQSLEYSYDAIKNSISDKKKI